jgi:hypothetical protein
MYSRGYGGKSLKKVDTVLKEPFLHISTAG